MKTQLFVFLFSFLSMGIFANSNPVFTKVGDKSITIKTGNWKSDAVNVIIKDADGATILSENLNTDKTGRVYNLKNLPAGIYSIEMSDDLRITTQAFTLNKDAVVMDKAVETLYKPVFASSDNTVDLNLMNLGNNVSIKITDRQNNTYLDQKEHETSINKRFDVSSLPAGIYTMSINMDGRTFSHDFTK